MASKKREKSETGFYHIMCKGVEYIFNEHSMKEYFEEKLNKFKSKYEIEIISSVIMSNHYHLEIYDPEDNITTFMRVLNSVFAKYYNKIVGDFGKVFKTLFKSKPIKDLSYFYNCKEYIEYNPVDAKIVENKEDYPYSSGCSYRKLKYISKKDLVESILEKVFGKIDYSIIRKVRIIKEELLRSKEVLIEDIYKVKSNIEKRYKRSIEDLLSEKEYYNLVIDEIKSRTYLSRYEISKKLNISYHKMLSEIEKTLPKY